MIIEEPFAYSWSTLALFLIVRALVDARRAGGSRGCGRSPSLDRPARARRSSPSCRSSFPLAARLLVWRSGHVAAWRRSWSRWDWVGASSLVVGAVVLFSARLRAALLELARLDAATTRTGCSISASGRGGALDDRARRPAGRRRLASLARVPRRAGDARARAFAASCSARRSSASGCTRRSRPRTSRSPSRRYTEERNLIYLAPLLFIGTALWLERRRLQPSRSQHPRPSSPRARPRPAVRRWARTSTSTRRGFAILQQGNRDCSSTPTAAKSALVALLCFSVALLLAPRFVGRGTEWLVVRGRRGSRARLESDRRDLLRARRRTVPRTASSRTSARPFDWVDDATGGAATLYLGQQMSDQNGEWLLEFWNRSIKPSGASTEPRPGPGPFSHPIAAPPTEPLVARPAATPYVVENPGSSRRQDGRDAPAPCRRRARAVAPLQITPPLRLRGSVTGVYSDGWMSAVQRLHALFDRAGTRPGGCA